MQKIIHRAEERGYFDHDWLETYHSFSFAGWMNRNKMNFGTLRVINDDTIAPDAGFGLHPHDNMEIITIIMEGEIKHSDSMGNEEIIHENEIQVMSAGSGIMHAEFNPSKINFTKLFQIWIFPKVFDIEPSYAQTSFINDFKSNEIIPLVGPKESNLKLTINQNAFISSLKFDKDIELSYKINFENNGLYVMVIEGTVGIADEILNRRDAIGLSDMNEIRIKALADSKVLFLEIPMER